MSDSIENKHESRKQKKKKGHGGVIFLFIMILLVGGAAALLYFNVYNLRNMAFDALRNIPLVGGFIPESDTAPPGRFASMSSEQMGAEIERLEKQVATLQEDKDTQQETINGLRNEVERLQDFEQQQEQFKIDQADFYAMVADEAPMDFWRFFQQMNPDQAAELAREAAGIAQNEAEIRQFIQTIKAMGEKEAAKALEVLMDTDATFVRDTMNRLDAETSGAILDNMVTDKRAALIKLMDPGGL